jgi:hypothetical protein
MRTNVIVVIPPALERVAGAFERVENFLVKQFAIMEQAHHAA